LHSQFTKSALEDDSYTILKKEF